MHDTVVNPIFKNNRESVLNLIATLPKELKTSKKILPNFLVLGPPKTATTSLYQYLKQHPDIYLPALKNPAFFIYEGQNRNFFGRNVINSLEAYYVLFQHVTCQNAIGEVSTGYLPDSSAPLRIYKHLPNVKMIAILRNPIERAVSQFCYNHQIGVERQESFQKVIDDEIAIINGEEREGNPKYIRTGFYYKHITKYYKFFNPNQFLFLFYDDFLENPLKAIRKIFSFLDIDSEFVPDLAIKHNVTNYDLITSKNVSSISNNLQASNIISTDNERIPAHLLNIGKLSLSPVYREDILSLQELLNKNLSKWLNINV